MKPPRILLISMALIISINIVVFSDNSFNRNETYNIISELSSSKYAGRLAGEKGNIMTQNYILNSFKKAKLKPLGDNNTYTQSFNIYVPHVDGKCTFNVYDKNKSIVHSFKYGIDFKEVTYGASSFGTVFGKIRTSKDANAFIKLFSNNNYGEETSDYISDYSLIKNGIKAVIYESSKIYSFRTPYKSQSAYSNGLVKIQVSDGAAEKIKLFSKKGYYYEIKSPVNFKKVNISNIIGKIDGRDPTLPPFIISAHFDHVGYDADGTIYPGALDNASGTAFLIECANYFKNIKPRRTIILAAFNAEEEGLLGSMYFTNHSNINLNGAECINFDMIGSKKNIPITLLSSPGNDNYVKGIIKIAKNLNINVRTEFDDNSDHAPFSYNGIPAVTFINSDVSKIHTPYDTIENIDKNKFNTFFTLLTNYMQSKGVFQETLKSSFSNPNNKYIYIAGIILISLLTLFIINYKKSRHK